MPIRFVIEITQTADQVRRRTVSRSTKRVWLGGHGGHACKRLGYPPE
jgi:hypothetical protein